MSADKHFFTGLAEYFEPFLNLKDTRAHSVQIIFGQVTDVILTADHPKYVSQANIGMVEFKELKATEPKTHIPIFATRWAIPATKNFKHIPVIGETILIIDGPSPWSYIRPSIQYAYYISTVTIFGNINYNPLPTTKTVSGSIEMELSKPGKYFAQKLHDELQPFEGDTIFESRFGSALRMSSAQHNPLMPWSGSSVGAPITILSTSKRDTKAPRIEDFKIDNLIILADDHEVPYVISAIQDNMVQLSSWDENITSFEPEVNTTDTSKIITDNSDSTQ